MSSGRVPLAVRLAVEDRAGRCCEYCRSQADYCPGPFTVDHVFPSSAGGPDGLDNLALACHGCNGHKYVATTHPDPVTGSPTPLFNPRRNLWADHFAWDATFERVVPLTATGRATADRLQLNRPPLLNLRRALRAIGRHPPA
jgi:hypothetical protein